METKKLWESLQEKAKPLLQGDRKIRIVLVIGLAGILLILLSELIPRQSAKAETGVQPETVSVTAESLEQRLTELVCCIDGAGKARVMITFEDGGESVYAQDTKTQTEQSTRSGESETTSGISEQAEGKYIFVENDSGRKEALLLSSIAPKIKGVVIVCEGADSIRVQEKLVKAVTVALGISSARVYVTKLAA